MRVALFHASTKVTQGACHIQFVQFTSPFLHVSSSQSHQLSFGSVVFNNWIDAVIDVIPFGPFFEKKVKNLSANTDPINLRGHGRACFQRYGSEEDCDPILLVSRFDHNPTPTASISDFATITAFTSRNA